MAMAPVLIVEDDATLVDAISRNLSARGYPIRSAKTVAEAIAALQDVSPALLLLDVDLPDGSGWEVLRTLRAQGHHAVPVIVMSALRPNDRLATEYKCEGVLEKPFPMDSLLRLVTDSIGRPASGPTPQSN
ncbi:MAG: response regulator [Chloroflexi bacterium]|jgi:DNA-binding response OmpR family regulator|nr:response regulator [Chloroflexota bacterium]